MAREGVGYEIAPAKKREWDKEIRISGESIGAVTAFPEQLHGGIQVYAFTNRSALNRRCSASCCVTNEPFHLTRVAYLCLLLR